MHRRWLVVLLVMIIGSAAACTRLQPPDPDPGVDLSDPNVGGGVGEETGPQTPVPFPSLTNEVSPRLDATAEALATYPPASPTLAPTRSLPTPSPSISVTESALVPAETPAPPAEGVPGESSETIHIVQPGENLYQIGLIYGISWVTIAEYNDIANPDAIDAGQEIRIPPAPAATDE